MITDVSLHSFSLDDSKIANHLGAILEHGRDPSAILTEESFIAKFRLMNMVWWWNLKYNIVSRTHKLGQIKCISWVMFISTGIFIMHWKQLWPNHFLRHNKHQNWLHYLYSLLNHGLIGKLHRRTKYLTTDYVTPQSDSKCSILSFVYSNEYLLHLYESCLLNV